MGGTRRARNKAEAKLAAIGYAANVLRSAPECWDIPFDFESEREYDRFMKEWAALVADMDRRYRRLAPGGGAEGE